MNELTRIAASLGFTITETGGGCTALTAVAPDGRYALLTRADDPSAPESLDEACVLGLVDALGEAVHQSSHESARSALALANRVLVDNLVIDDVAITAILDSLSVEDDDSRTDDLLLLVCERLDWLLAILAEPTRETAIQIVMESTPSETARAIVIQQLEDADESLVAEAIRIWLAQLCPVV